MIKEQCKYPLLWESQHLSMEGIGLVGNEEMTLACVTDSFVSSFLAFFRRNDTTLDYPVSNYRTLQWYLKMLKKWRQIKLFILIRLAGTYGGACMCWRFRRVCLLGLVLGGLKFLAFRWDRGHISQLSGWIRGIALGASRLCSVSLRATWFSKFL